MYLGFTGIQHDCRHRAHRHQRTEEAITPETIETLVTIADDDLPIMVRAWFSYGYGGWMWTAIAEGHDEVVSGKRAWVSARRATEMAVSALTRRYA